MIVSAPLSCVDYYTFGEKLGEGSFATIVSAKRKSTEGRDETAARAIKIVSKERLSKEASDALSREIAILTILQHKHIIHLYESYNEANHHYLIFEQLQGGTLYDRLNEKTCFDERISKLLCKNLFSALAYCHSKNVVHRDLKPENIMLVSKHDDTNIKIIDFGFAKIALDPMCLSTQCGTPHYAAPEILKGELYGTKADVWSLGVITYMVLAGYAPFTGGEEADLFEKVRGGRYKFHKKYWSNISENAKNFIQRLLLVDPRKRLDASNALEHKWFTRSSMNNNRLSSMYYMMKRAMKMGNSTFRVACVLSMFVCYAFLLR